MPGFPDGLLRPNPGYSLLLPPQTTQPPPVVAPNDILAAKQAAAWPYLHAEANSVMGFPIVALSDLRMHSMCVWYAKHVPAAWDQALGADCQWLVAQLAKVVPAAVLSRFHPGKAKVGNAGAQSNTEKLAMMYQHPAALLAETMVLLKQARRGWCCGVSWSVLRGEIGVQAIQIGLQAIRT